MNAYEQNFKVRITLYPSSAGGRNTPIQGNRFKCPCKFDARDHTAWDCQIMLDGKTLAPGETLLLEVQFMSPELAPDFRSAKKFYLWEGRIIGEAAAIN